VALSLTVALLPGCSEDTPTSMDGTHVPAPDAITDIGADSATKDSTVQETDIVQDAISDIVSRSETGNGASACSTELLMEMNEVELLNGETSEFSFEVPSNAGSISITVEGIPGTSYALASWAGPASVLIEDGWMQMPENQGGICFTCPVRIAPSQGAHASMTPNNPDAIVESGLHTARVLAFTLEGGFGGLGGQMVPATGTVSLRVHAKLKTPIPDTGILNLNLHFTGSRGWSSDTAPSDPEFQKILDTMSSTYEQVGISLGRIDYFDVDPLFQVIESIDGEDSDLGEMFRLSEGTPEDAVNVFFVDELVGPFGRGFGVLLGIAGGIPGPILTPGSARSGVAIATKEQEQIDAAIETTVAHEVGHYLGLFHMLEDNLGGLFPTIYDPLPDTPETNDTDWLMHFNGSGTKLSPWQGTVMRSNPVLCH
jgi:hypothetical protein